VPVGDLRGKESAKRVKPGRLTRRQAALLPEDVGRGQSRMAAELHFGERGEPAKVVVAVRPPQDESRLGEVHFPGHVLEPSVAAG
jgi:hypothetical protein